MRQRFRPDLIIPVDGLTMSLEGPGTGYWKGSKAVRFTLKIKNHSADGIDVDLSAGNLRFSIVDGSGKRSILVSEWLPPSDPAEARAHIESGGSITRTWALPRLASSAVGKHSRGGYTHVRCEYVGRARVTSNSIVGYYFPGE